MESRIQPWHNSMAVRARDFCTHHPSTKSNAEAANMVYRGRWKLEGMKESGCMLVCTSKALQRRREDALGTPSVAQRVASCQQQRLSHETIMHSTAKRKLLTPLPRAASDEPTM